MSFKLVLFLLAALLLVSSSSVSARTWDDEKQLRTPSSSNVSARMWDDEKPLIPRRPGRPRPPRRRQRQPQPQPQPLPSNWLVLTWPPGYCRVNGCGIMPQIFIIHGLWPINNSNGGPWIPQHQPNNNLNENRIRKSVTDLQLWKDMNGLWPTLNPRINNVQFWMHEWNEHGRFTRLNANQYFPYTVDQAKGHIYHLMTGLVQQGKNRHYNNQEFSQALIRDGSTFQLACNKIEDENEARYYLSEVQICSDRNGCPKKPTTPQTAKCGNMQRIWL